MEGAETLHQLSEFHSCKYFIAIRTKYPYIIAFYNLKKSKRYEDRIYVAKPSSWPDIKHQERLLDNSTFQFALQNVSIHSVVPMLKSLHYCKSTNSLTIHRNGVMQLSVSCQSQPVARFTLRRAKSYSLKHLMKNRLCDVRDIFPGRWKLDPEFRISDVDKWNNCPVAQKTSPGRAYVCPSPYYASQYYPNSACYILPLRLSLHILYSRLERSNILGKSNYAIQKKRPFYNPLYTFIGDSLNGQIMEAGNCELESHYDTLSLRKQYYPKIRVDHGSGVDGNDFTLTSIWNQYLRNDYPCQPKCLTNQTFAETDGRISAHSYLPPPCKGCSNRVKMGGKVQDHPEAFEYLEKVPLETRIVVINGGAWFSEHFLVLNGTTVFRETLEALLPQLAKLQRERNYQLDLYFLTLPGVDPATAKKTSFDWGEYEKRNRIISDVFSEGSMGRYNITVTVLHNDRFFFDRRKKVDGDMISTPDRLHYCVPGAFSPPSFLFEVILHFHVRNRLKQEGLIDSPGDDY